MAVRNILSTNKQTIWLCKKTSDTTWDTPKKYSINVMRVNDTGEIVAFGSTFPENLVCVCPKSVSKNFNVGDRVYYNKTPPSTHNTLQNKKEDANFIVNTKPTDSLNTSEIRLTYLKGR